MNRLKELREKSGYTQETVATRLNITQSAVSQWEKGDTFPSRKILIRLSELYGCTTDELLNYEKVGT